MIGISLAKYIVIVLVLCGLVFTIHSSGRKVERAQCQQEQQDFSARAEQLRRQAEVERIEEKRAYDENLMRLINDKQKAQADLNQRMHELATGGLWINASTTCSSGDRMPGKTENTRVDDRAAGPDKIRLPRKVEGNLLAIGYDAAELVDKYNDLRELCLPLVDVVD